jgi:cytoskeleton protein RodZ
LSIGAELAEARRQAGLSVAQVSQRTRIRAPIIEGIERDDFSVCGGDFYARGHIRAIARVAGVDPEPLVREYDDAREAATSEDIPVSRPRRAGRPGLVTGTAAGLASQPGQMIGSAPTPPGTGRTGAGTPGMVVTGRPGPLPGGPGRDVQPPRRAPWTIVLLVLLAAAVGVIVYHVATSHQPAAPAAAPGTPAAARKPAATPRPSATPAARPTTPPASPTPGPSNVVISLAVAGEPCWAQLTTSSGTTIYQGIVAAGTSMSWTEGQPVTLDLGNPGAVTLTVDGKVDTGLGTNPITLNLAPGQAPSG